MVTLDIDAIFDAAIRIQLILEKNFSVTFTPGGVSIKMPTTRRLAEYFDVPHYYVLPYFAMMEQENLVTRAERVGIMTTPRGTKKLMEIMRQQYAAEAEAMLGPAVFTELLRRADQ